MTYKCPTCFTELEDTNPAQLLKLINDKVSDAAGWSAVATKGYLEINSIDFGDIAKVVSSKITYDMGDIEDDYYDGLPQGTEFETHVVLEVDGNYFKKTGTGDSYGKVSWDGDLIRVTPRTIEKVVFE